MRARMFAPAQSPHTELWRRTIATTLGGVEVISAFRGSGMGPLRSVRTAAVQAAASLFSRPDLDVVHSLGTHGLLSLLSRRGRRCVVVPWGSEVERARRSALRRAVGAAVLRRADAALVTSESMKRTLHELWPRAVPEVRVISWGVDDAFLYPSDAPLPARSPLSSMGDLDGEVRFVCARGTTETYRYSLLRAVFERIREDVPQARLIVIDLSRVAGGSVDLGERITQLPRLSKGELTRLYAGADAALSLAVTDQRSTSVLEALASGTPVIVSDIPAYRELIHDGFDMVMLDEPLGESLEAAMREVIRDGKRSFQGNRDLARTMERQAVNMDVIADIMHEVGTR